MNRNSQFPFFVNGLFTTQQHQSRPQPPSPQTLLQQPGAKVDCRHAEAAAPGGALPDWPLPKGEVHPKSVPFLCQLPRSG